tara:strand:- start:53 stop:688 length:636 start_codon:yes stop_codon:yes gene_type:complete
MKQIKNRDRVTKFAEVNTSQKEIENMLNLVEQETLRIESRFLESACGDGNFLLEILSRKLKIISTKYKKNQYEFERNSIVMIGSLYGIDILLDNTLTAKKRLLDKFLDRYKELFKEKISEEFIKSIKFILNKNIVHGDALTLNKVNSKDPIVFSQWNILDNKVKRRDYSFANLISYAPFDKGTLFSDLGDEVSIPKTVKDYKLVDYKKIYK